MFKINRIVSYKLLEENFEAENIDNIEFRKYFGEELFINKDAKKLYTVKLEYDRCDEFFLTNKIDAEFFCRENDDTKGVIVFEASDLEWTADLVITLQDKVRVVEPCELKEKVKLKINNMMSMYKYDI